MSHRRHHRRRHRRDPYLPRLANGASSEGALGGEAGSLPFEIVDAEGHLAEPDEGADPVAVDEEPVEAAGDDEAEVTAVPVAEAASPATAREPEDLLRAARDAVEGGELTRGAALYQELLAVAPASTGARGELALVLERLGDHDTALAELDLCVARDPDNVPLRLARGGVRATQGLLAEAQADVRHALAVDPASADAHTALGALLSRKGLWRDAIPSLRRAVELDPSRAAAWDRLGEALNHVDDLDGALQAFHRSTELRPNNARALRGLGIVYDRMNRPAEAAQMYRRSRELQGT